MQFAMKYLLFLSPMLELLSCEHKLSVNRVAVPDVDHQAKEGYLNNLMDNIALKKETMQASDLSMVNDVSENGYMFCTMFPPPPFLLYVV